LFLIISFGNANRKGKELNETMSAISLTIGSQLIGHDLKMGLF